MEKGQIFSLDFLIALVAVTAALGLLIQSVEVNMYYQKETMRNEDLKNVAETTTDLIISSNKITCEDGSGNHLMNCIRTDMAAADLEKEIKDMVPFPGYGYDITGFGGTVSVGPPEQNKDYYEVRRRVVLGSPTGPEQTLSVKVWLQNE